MSVKTVVAALLLVALLDQSGAFKLAEPQGDTAGTQAKTGTHDTTGLQINNGLPAITFFRSVFTQVRLYASEGRLMNYDAITNTTKWERSTYERNNIKSVKICQNIAMPVLSAAYPGAFAKFGPYRAYGEPYADLGSNEFRICVNATQYSRDNCALKITPTLLKKLEVEMDLDDMGYVGVLLLRVRSLVKGIENAVIESLNGDLESRLGYLFEQDIFLKKLNINLVGFCRELLASSGDRFPEPLFDEITPTLAKRKTN